MPNPPLEDTNRSSKASVVKLLSPYCTLSIPVPRCPIRPSSHNGGSQLVSCSFNLRGLQLWTGISDNTSH
eukprot:141218-Rhodomonas_salina.2